MNNCLNCRGTIELHSNILKDIKPEIKDEFDDSYKENLPPGDFHNISHIKNDENNSIDIKKKSSLIIDQCIKLEDKDMIDQINIPIRNLRGVTKMSFKKLQIKRMLQAKELLKRFNKRQVLSILQSGNNFNNCFYFKITVICCKAKGKVWGSQ